MSSPERHRLVVIASTFPVRRGDGVPAFVWDLAEQEAREFDTVALVPHIRDAPRRERVGALTIQRFRYFPARWEDLADGAILENLRARPSRWLQVVPFLVAEGVALRRLVRSFRPDVLHVHWLIPQGLVARWAAPTVPQVLTTLGGDVYALQARLARALKGIVLRRAAVVTVMNQDMRRRLIELGADPATTLVAPMGADVESIRAALDGAERHPGRLLFAGRMVEKKGVAVLIEALRGAGGSWSLDLVGDGPLRPALESSAAGLGGRVRWLGTLDRPALAAAMASCEIFVLPSVAAASGDQDGLPVVLLEAMAAGCAVVASRLPGIAEVVEDGRTGLLVPPGDPGALRDAIERLLGDRGLRDRLGASAQVAAEAFSAEAAGRRYVRLLQGAMTGQVDLARPAAAPGRERHRQGRVRVVDGVPYPTRASTLSLLPNGAVCQWLHANRDRVNGRLLDVGCGNRPYADWYAPLVKESIALDATAGDGVEVLGFADRLPFADQSFDTILCTEVLEHVGDAEQAASELYRVCRPGGHVLATVPFLYPTHEAPYDFRRFTHFGLRDLMARHGFEVVSLESKGGPGLLVGHALVLGAVQVVEALAARRGRRGARGGGSRLLRAALGAPQEAYLRRGRLRRPVEGSARQLSLGYMLVARRPG